MQRFTNDEILLASAGAVDGLERYGGFVANRVQGKRKSGQVPFLFAEQRRGWSMMIFCAHGTRGLSCKKVKVEAQVEQRSIRLGVFSTLNLDLSLDLPMGRAQ